MPFFAKQKQRPALKICLLEGIAVRDVVSQNSSFPESPIASADVLVDLAVHSKFHRHSRSAQFAVGTSHTIARSEKCKN